ncbi:MAG: tRNA pseudouridine(55) synthase TruB, partial [Eggerthellaceae bacterium]|nr:tRNA pseudouridine(55) synthase TruB [Eggerthellaceae bacterium]
TGALLVCIGPATRLDRFLTGHDKTYRFSIVFGTQTDTDDAQGSVVAASRVPAEVSDESFARKALSCMVGPSQQLPPAYSSVKVGGKTAHREAREGRSIALAPRNVVVHSLELIEVDLSDPAAPLWRLRTHVSAGTYVRSLARDLGASVGTYAHVGTLRRMRAGALSIEDCVSLDTLVSDPTRFLLDPVKLLGMRVVFVDGPAAKKVASGAPLKADGLELFGYSALSLRAESYCSCTSGIEHTGEPLRPNEEVAVVCDNKLAAIYAYSDASAALRSVCGFSIGVSRGGDL